ncbi:MAG: hypothetical protein JW910_04315 [Anaerolineae bacterium]|nr:hypothetical protein [Anaerolineae bacterium]
MCNIVVGWDDDSQTTIRVDFASRWTPADFRTAVDGVVALADSVPHAVGVMLHLQSGEYMPTNLVRYLNMIAADPQPPASNVCLCVLVGDRLVQAFFRATIRVQGGEQAAHRLAYAPDPDAARALIAARRRNRAVY